MPSAAQVFLSEAATCRQSLSFSITHGPAIKNSRRVEIFPDGSVVEHTEVLAAAGRKVNGARRPRFFPRAVELRTNSRILRVSPRESCRNVFEIGRAHV